MKKKNDTVNPELLAPLRLLTSVSRYECKNCGHISEITLKSAQGFIKTMEILGNLPEISEKIDFKNYYFSISYCYHCQKNNTKKNWGREIKVELKIIKKELE